MADALQGSALQELPAVVEAALEHVMCTDPSAFAGVLAAAEKEAPAASSKASASPTASVDSSGASTSTGAAAGASSSAGVRPSLSDTCSNTDYCTAANVILDLHPQKTQTPDPTIMENVVTCTLWQVDLPVVRICRHMSSQESCT